MPIRLPEDLTVEILTRLPVKALLRFRCVNKWGSSVIFSKDFVDLQLKRASSNPGIGMHKLCIEELHSRGIRSLDCQMVPNDKPRYRSLDLPSFFTEGSDYKTLGSCNGLICLSRCDCKELTLWNPATREYKIIAPLKHERTRTVTRFGFGYDKSRDDYKLFVATIDNQNVNPVAEYNLFSLRNNCWRRFKDTDNVDCSLMKIGAISRITFTKLSARRPKGVFSNGALHWFEGSENGGVIVSFDLIEESFKSVPFPDIVNGGLLCLGVLDDFLCLTVRIRDSNVIWIQKEYGVDSSWTKLATIVHSHPEYGWQPLCFTSSGEIMLKKDFDYGIFNAYMYKLVLFDPDKGYVQYVHGASGTATLYVESLVSPNGFCKIQNNHKRRRHM